MEELKPGPLVEQCLTGKGCERADREVGVCPVYISPASWWRRGGCPMATHVSFTKDEMIEKTRVGQQKQKKKGK